MRKYSPQVIEHFTNPRNLGELPDPDVTAEAANPCCGDRLRLQARVVDDRIVACSFLAYGCAVSLAVGSLLSEAVTGATIGELDHFNEDRVADLAGGLGPGQRHSAALGNEALRALARNYREAGRKGTPV